VGHGGEFGSMGCAVVINIERLRVAKTFIMERAEHHHAIYVASIQYKCE